MRIDSNSPSLTPEERRRMAAIAERLRERYGKPPSRLVIKRRSTRLSAPASLVHFRSFERF